MKPLSIKYLYTRRFLFNFFVFLFCNTASFIFSLFFRVERLRRRGLIPLAVLVFFFRRIRVLPEQNDDNHEVNQKTEKKIHKTKQTNKDKKTNDKSRLASQLFPRNPYFFRFSFTFFKEKRRKTSKFVTLSLPLRRNLLDYSFNQPDVVE